MIEKDVKAYHCFSRLVGRAPKIKNFLDFNMVIQSKLKSLISPAKAIILWGRSKSVKQQTRLNEKYDKSILTLEEGFISYSVNKETSNIRKFPLMSLIVDPVGIYYDATCASELENLLNEVSLTDLESCRVDHLIRQLLQWNITKFNDLDAELPELFKSTLRPKVLVVDQTFGDRSITYGLASTASFCEMLAAAIQDNPSAEIIVKLHPKVIDGTKKSYLLNIVGKYPHVKVYSGNANPVKMIQNIDKVYTVTSQLGFEALLAGKEVYCFGMPFYAGWGLTKDRLSCSRRCRNLTVQELFFASYIQYPRYLQPVTHVRCEIEDIFEHLILQHEKRSENAGDWLCVGVKKHKKAVSSGYLQGANSIKFSSRITDRNSINKKILIWSSHKAQLGSAQNLPLHMVEDGFIRSVGLGAKFIKPNSLPFDFNGIYYDGTRVSRLENILNYYAFSTRELALASDLITQCRTMNITKYNLPDVDQDSISFVKGKKKVILIPGQVPKDASIKYGSIDVRTNLDLVKLVRQNYSDAFIIYKPHPDNAINKITTDPVEKSVYEIYSNLYVDNLSLLQCLSYTDEVHTLTSLTGFEALIRGIAVYTYGLPFYAGWGLTIDRHSTPRRTRRLSLEQLVAGALIIYPRYYDYDSKSFTTAKHLIEKMKNKQS